MDFSFTIQDKKLRSPLLLGHYLPWFTREKPDDFPCGEKDLKGLILPRMEAWRHWRDSRSQYKRTHLYQPLWGEYDSRDPQIIRKQIETAKKYGLDGFIVNLYGKNSVENIIGLSFLKELEKYNFEHRDDPFLYMISFDSQAQWPTEGKTPVSIEEDFEYLRDKWFGKYCISRNGAPCMAIFVYDRKASEYRRAADTVFGKDGLDIIWPSCDGSEGADAAYAWVRPDSFERDGSWFDTDNPGDKWLESYYLACNKNRNLRYIMGGVWPGFNDLLVSWAWNPNPSNPAIRPRVMCRESTRGNSLELTFMAAENYLRRHKNGDPSCAKPMPFIQIVTWNDWAEATNVEPDADFGFKSLEICAKFAKRLKEI